MAEPLLKHGIKPQRHFDKASWTHTQEEEEKAVVSAGRPVEAKQTELFEEGRCAFREGWTDVKRCI